jgi:hypothetical protein
VHRPYTYEDSIMTPTNGGRRRREERKCNAGGGELVQGTMYTCRELSQ